MRISFSCSFADLEWLASGQVAIGQGTPNKASGTAILIQSMAEKGLSNRGIGHKRDRKMKLTIQAFSSSGGSYPVEFSDDSGVFRVFCHCQAGITQQMCKHKAAFIRGDATMLFNPAEAPLLKQVQCSPAYPPLKAQFDEFEKHLNEVEREMAKLKEKEKSLKKDFAYLLSFGKPAAAKTITKLEYVKGRTGT